MATNFILNSTPIGVIPTKAMSAFVPISVSEIVKDVHKATETGITMVRLHARDPKSLKPVVLFKKRSKNFLLKTY